MALAKRTRFILVQSTSNNNVNEDNMEPYHISIFRRSTSMPPLPKLSSVRKIDSFQFEQQHNIQSESFVTPRCQRHEKDEALANKFYRLNIHSVKKKSARFSMRLSSAFGLSTYTIDEQFNFQEQRFRAVEKFSKILLRNVYLCIEALREIIITQVDIAEVFEELLIDKMPDLAQQFLRSKRLFLEITLTDFCNHVESHFIQPINILLKLFGKPANLIAKRHKKLLDYDSAQSAYEKVKDQQFRQAKQFLDLSRQAYETLNNQLLEELPILYEHSSQILSICLKEFIRTHLYLIQRMRANTQIVLNQVITPAHFSQLNWERIFERFITKKNLAAEVMFQLTITSKNFIEKLKSLSSAQISSLMSNLYNYDKDNYVQTDEVRRSLQEHHLESNLFAVTQEYTGSSCDDQSINSRSKIVARNGDIVAIISPNDRNSADVYWFVDNGVTRGYLPRSILVPLSVYNQMDAASAVPPPPVRHDLPPTVQTSLSESRRNSTLDNSGPQPIVARTASLGPKHQSVNSSQRQSKQNEPIYVNQMIYQDSSMEADEFHQYATIDCDDPAVARDSEAQQQIYVALYDFNYNIEGVLSLKIGDRLRVLQRSDEDKNEEWWYVENIDDTRQRGYVPANYIRVV